MSKIKILDATKGLQETARSVLDRIQEMQLDADRQAKAMRDVESRIVSIEKTKQTREEQRKKEAAEQKSVQAGVEKDEKAARLSTAAESVKPEEPRQVAEPPAAQKTQTVAAASAVAEDRGAAAGAKSDAAAAASVRPQTTSEKSASTSAAAAAQAVSAPEQTVSASASESATKQSSAADEIPQTRQTPAEEQPAVQKQSAKKKQTSAAAAAVPTAQKSTPADQRPAQSGAARKPAAQKQQSAQRQQPAQRQQQPSSQKQQSGQRQRSKQTDVQPSAQRTAPGRQSRPGGPQGGPGQQRGSDHGRKKREDNNQDRKKKKSGIKERVFSPDYDEAPKGSRRRGGQRRQQKRVQVEPMRIDHAVITEDTVSVKLLSEKIGKPVTEILKKLLLLGMTSTINSQIDFDTAQLVSSEFGVDLEQKLEKTAEEILVEETEDTEDQLVKRPPVVTIMGHVDHGKTSLLDRIRVAHVTETEAGGITQHIGAYQVELRGEKITFIDTPGHEAFTAMRARGAQVTDVAVIVVAADDGIMPQTIEAINHAKAADVPIVVAVNKIDRENANVPKIMQELTEYELLPEEWGGDTIVVPVSAKTGEGIDKLLEMILLVADMQELRANPNRLARGTIVEAQLDKGRGPVATVLVQNGTLKTGDTIIAGVAFGRVRAMVDDRGNTVREALPSQPVEVIGFSEVPVAGDLLHAADGSLSKKVAEERRAQQKVDKLKKGPQVSLDDLFNQISEGQIKDLNIVIKADVQGSVEAVRQSLEKLSNDEVRVRAIHTGVGAITETDVMLASAANAIIIGFNVRPDNMAVSAAEHEQVDIRLYRVIYKAIEDIENAMVGMLEPEFEEVVIGHAEVRQTFKASSVGTIAGCYVLDGVIKRNGQIRLLRDSVVVYEGVLSSLRRFKDDVKEVSAGYECGMSLESFNDIKEGDVFESFEMQQIER